MKLIATLLVSLLALPAAAHDFWIEPSAWAPAAGEVVRLHLKVGSAFIGDPVPRDPALIDRFELETRNGATAVAGIEGSDPAGIVRSDGRCSVVAYQSRPSAAALTPEKFAQYVRDESLGSQVSRMPASTVTDRFSRSALAILRGGGDCLDAAKRAGLTLHLVPLADPATASQLPIELRFNGRPLANVTVIGFAKRQPLRQQRVNTDRNGRAVVNLDLAGPWLVKCVRIELQQDGSYRSHWASLTFAR